MKLFFGLTSGVVVGVVGIFSGQPSIMMAGTAIATAASTSVVMAKEQEKYTNILMKNFEDTLATTYTTHQTIIQRFQQELKATTQTTEEMAKKIRLLNTSNRLMVSKLQELQHQQKLTTATLIREQRKDIPTVSQKNIPSIIENKVVQLPMSKKPASMTHIYIDGNNFNKALEMLGVTVDWKALKNTLVELADNTDMFTLKYCTGLPDNGGHEQIAWLNKLKRLKYEVMTFPLSPRGNGQWKTVGDDMAIGVNLMDTVKSGDQVILVTGDGDFIPLIERLQARKAQITVIGASANTSQRLQQLLSQGFISLESIIHKIVKLHKLKSA